MRHTLAAALAALTLTAGPAVAGIVDSPLPVLDPAGKTIHLYSVPGVMNDAGTDLATFFACTSTTTGLQTVGIELFGAGGGGPINNAVTSSIVVPAGGTVLFGTAGGGNTDRNLLGGVLPKGSARILSTSKSLICTAFVAEAVNATPNSGWQLTIIAKTKQKAAN